MLVRLACLPLPFICLPLLFICLPVLFRVGFCGAGLSPTSCHLSPTSFHLSPRLGACGRVPGWLVSHFLSFVSHFFSFVRLGLVVGFAAGLSPTCFHLSPTSFICLPVLFICLPVLFIFGLPGWVLVVGFPAGLSRICLLLLFTCLLSFHLSGSRPACLPLPFPLLFICLPVLFIVSGACGRGFAAGLSPTSFHLSPTSFHLSPTSFHLSPTSYHLSPRLGACGRVSGWLVSPRAFICLPLLSFVSQFFSFVSHFFSFPKQFTVRGSQCFKEWSPWCWMVWSGSQPACLPLPLSPSSFQSGFPAGLSPTSFHLPPNSFHSPNSLQNGRLGAGWSGRVPGRLVSHFLLFVSHFFSFVSQARCLWSGSRLACPPLPFICLPLLFICLPVLFICLPGWVLVVGFPAGLSPTSFHLGSHFLSFVSHFFSFVSHFFSFVSQFFSFVSQAGYHLCNGPNQQGKNAA